MAAAQRVRSGSPEAVSPCVQVCLVGQDGTAVLRRLDPIFDPTAIEREVASICAQVRRRSPRHHVFCHGSQLDAFAAQGLLDSECASHFGVRRCWFAPPQRGPRQQFAYSGPATVVQGSSVVADGIVRQACGQECRRARALLTSHML